MPRTTAALVKSLPPRMVPVRVAAFYAGRSVKEFRAICPVPPSRYADGKVNYDLRKIDAWLDDLDGNAANSLTKDDWLAKLDEDEDNGDRRARARR